MTETSTRFLGRQVGNYTLTSVLGTGGFADVYLGTHKHLETQAAIKVLRMQMNQADQERFLAEARLLARLKHPHIVQILEFGFENNMPYLVMNYAAHGTLRRRFQRGVRLTPDAFLHSLKQVALALQYAHEQGLIHRDIKPENMLVDERDEVFLSDFGIATRIRSSSSQSVEDIIGTVAYMAPEQLQGKPRPASDQYSLAVVVYEWLTGTLPFQGTTYLAIAGQHVTKPPLPLREHVPTIAPTVEQVVLTALAKDHHQRYARVQDFADALEKAHLNGQYFSPQDFAGHLAESTPAPGLELASHAETVPTPDHRVLAEAVRPLSPGSSLSRRVLIGGGLTTLALASGGLTWWTATHVGTGQPTGANGQGPSSSSALQSRFLTQASLIHTYKHPTKVTSVAWSKDSQYVASVEDDTVVHVWKATTGEDFWTTGLLAMPQIVQVAWSPDGKSLAVIEIMVNADNDYPLGQIEIYDTTSHKQRSYFAFTAEHIAWAPDSTFLAATGASQDGSGQIFIWDGNTNHDPAYYFSLFDVSTAIAWKADSKELAIGLTNPDGLFSWVIIWPLGSQPDTHYTNKFTLRSVLGDNSTLSWSSANNWIVSAGSAAVEIWDATSLGKSYNRPYSQYAQPAVWSPDGLYLASATTSDKTIRVWNGKDVSMVSTCADQGDTITSISWSPDGRYLASTTQGAGEDHIVRVWQVAH